MNKTRNIALILIILIVSVIGVGCSSPATSEPPAADDPQTSTESPAIDESTVQSETRLNDFSFL